MEDRSGAFRICAGWDYFEAVFERTGRRYTGLEETAMTVIDLESEVLKLTPKDRARIAQKLLESLETLSKQEIESLWLDEAERRDRALDEDPSRAIPAAEVMREARARLS